MLRRYIIPSLIAIFASLIVVLVIDRQYADITALLAKEQSIDADIEKAEKVNQRITELTERSRAFPADADQRLRALLPESIHPALLLLSIQKIAERNGLRLETPTAETGKAKEGSNTQETTASFKVKTTYGQLKSFLRDIEKGLTLRSPVSISISTDIESKDIPELAGNPIVIAEFRLTSYSFSGSVASNP